jgi:hypothetical protein
LRSNFLWVDDVDFVEDINVLTGIVGLGGGDLQEALKVIEFAYLGHDLLVFMMYLYHRNYSVKLPPF